MSSTNTSITFGPTAAGPPFGANGGLVAGRLAERIGRWSGVVRFDAPVPLGRPVELVAGSDGASFSEGGRTLAALVPASPVPVHHVPVSFDDAVAASVNADVSDHPYPGCVVCGPARSPDDGLRLLCGPTHSGVAAPWVPRTWQGEGSGVVSTRWVTAALDCPSGIATMHPGEPILLASFTFAIRRRPVVGERLVVTGQAVSRTGRKLVGSSTVHDASGALVASARALWVVVNAAQIAALAAA